MVGLLLDSKFHVETYGERNNAPSSAATSRRKFLHFLWRRILPERWDHVSFASVPLLHFFVADVFLLVGYRHMVCKQS